MDTRYRRTCNAGKNVTYILVSWNETLASNFPAGRFCWKFDSKFSLAQNRYLLNFKVIGRTYTSAAACSWKIVNFKKSWYNPTYVPTYVRTGFYVCRIIKKPLLLQNIRNRQSDWPENCSATALHYFTLAEQISGQSDRWFLIFCNSKVTGSVSFQDTSSTRDNVRSASD